MILGQGMRHFHSLWLSVNGFVICLMSSGVTLAFFANVYNHEFDVCSGIHYWRCQPSQYVQWQVVHLLKSCYSRVVPGSSKSRKSVLQDLGDVLRTGFRQ